MLCHRVPEQNGQAVITRAGAPGIGANALAIRPQLAAAVKTAKKQKAAIMVARIDRLSRSVALVSELIGSRRITLVSADLPDKPSDFAIHLRAILAEEEVTPEGSYMSLC